MNTFILFYMH
uniref:Uncharacterized protein n=1 Tax=Rhizophora mucronata TaxID=61149 RepID=A0A2P2QZB1_RHIMU